jgi:hypothetical protein
MPDLVMLGADVVVLEHALAPIGHLPDAELTVIPGTSHGLLVEPWLCNWIIIDFVINDPVWTFAPIRRARR